MKVEAEGRFRLACIGGISVTNTFGGGNCRNSANRFLPVIKSGQLRKPRNTDMSDGLKNLVSKIRRLHSAVGSATELDYKKFPPKLFVTQQTATLRQDFNAGLSEEELLNLAFQVIRSIADLKDYLRSAAKDLKQDPDDVDRAINNCLELALMMDLANSDKHSRLPRAREQWSKKSPRLTEVKRVLQIVGKGLRSGSMMGLADDAPRHGSARRR